MTGINSKSTRHDSNNFSEVERLLTAARNAAYDPKAVTEVEDYISSQRSRVAEQQRREEQERQQQQARQQQAPQPSKSTTSSGGCQTWVRFTFDGPGPDGIGYGSISMSDPSGVYKESCSDNVCTFSGNCMSGGYSFKYSISDTEWIPTGSSQPAGWS